MAVLSIFLLLYRKIIRLLQLTEQVYYFVNGEIFVIQDQIFIAFF